MIDYGVDSSTVSGGKSKGSLYLRGIRGQRGFDSFKFVLEKGVDFSKLDSDIIIGVLEEINRLQPPEVQSTDKN